MSEWANKRRHPRYPIRLPVLYKVTAPALGKAGVGWTRDLSERGACLELTEHIEPMSVLTLVLRTDKGSPELEAVVLWAAKSGVAGQAALHGVSFAHLTGEQQKAVYDLLPQKGHARLEGYRRPLELPVVCRPKGRTDPILRGRTGDVSRGGLFLLLPEAIPPDSVLQITIQTTRGNVEAEGTIVWVDPVEQQTPGGLVRHGFKFTDISWPNQMTLGLLLAEMP